MASNLKFTPSQNPGDYQTKSNLESDLRVDIVTIDTKGSYFFDLKRGQTFLGYVVSAGYVYTMVGGSMTLIILWPLSYGTKSKTPPPNPPPTIPAPVKPGEVALVYHFPGTRSLLVLENCILAIRGAVSVNP